MRNKKTIKITYIQDMGKAHNLYCDTVLMLRTARRAGDIETVNHYVFGRLKEVKGRALDFEVIA